MFGLNIDKRTITIIIIVLASAWLLSKGTAGILDKLLVLPAVLIAMTFHEYAHAYAATKLRR